MLRIVISTSGSAIWIPVSLCISQSRSINSRGLDFTIMSCVRTRIIFSASILESTIFFWKFLRGRTDYDPQSISFSYLLSAHTGLPTLKLPRLLAQRIFSSVNWLQTTPRHDTVFKLVTLFDYQPTYWHLFDNLVPDLSYLRTTDLRG
jgi:hypothetical protein